MGRAIVRDPQVFLFDEPLSNLDAKLRVQMRAEIRELHQRLSTTTVYVTHDQIEAMTMADQIVGMQDGQIEQIGSPLEVYDRPANTFVASFIGSPAMNMLDAEVAVDGGALQARVKDTGLRLPEIVGLSDGQPIIIGVRPEHLLPASDGLAAEIAVVEPTGSETHIVARSGGSELTSVLRERTALQVGQPVTLTAQPDDIHIFNRETGQRLA